MKWIFYTGLLIFLSGCTTMNEKFEYLPFGEVKPSGWILEQMNKDMAGFTGHLDELVPDLTTADDIYGKNRLSKKDKSKDVGNLKEGADWEVQYLWWNSETQSNWRDGEIRQAILTGNPEQMKKIGTYIDHILSTQDSNGYLGIYDKNLRYRFKTENGELWAKATLLRGMLACYESGTGNRDTLLSSMERAVKDVMVNYPRERSDPFKAENSFAGICHGLVFTDILDRLYQITGKREYINYAAFLYRNYSANKLMEEDICLDNILNPKYKLKGHGVHTYEQLRSLTVAWFATGDKQLKKALDIYLRRIDSVTTPSGGPVGDEWIGGRKADASETGYEYCSIQELLDSYALLLQKTGKQAFGDKIERIFFNAAQGARHPAESSIAYLKTDNSWYMTGPLNDTVPVKRQTRYKYSPVHQDVAVCCVPNAGRIASYYVRSMWMRDRQGLVATLLGPSTVKTRIGKQLVEIEEQTEYPFGYSFRFAISLESPGKFVLKFRKPSWANGFTVNYPHEVRNGYILIKKTWKNHDEVILTFVPETGLSKDLKGESYFTFGPLVLAHPVEGKQTETKSYPLPGFKDVEVYASDPLRYRMGNRIFIQQADPGKLIFTADLINPETGREEPVKLVPMGQTLLRQVTFKKP